MLDTSGHSDSDWALDDDSEKAIGRDLAMVVVAVGGWTQLMFGSSMSGMTIMVAVGQGLVNPAALVLVDVLHLTDPIGF